MISLHLFNMQMQVSCTSRVSAKNVPHVSVGTEVRGGKIQVSPFFENELSKTNTSGCRKTKYSKKTTILYLCSQGSPR